ncbi:MAG: hypothetical protein ABFS86_08210 [Planctomycetota bacterium]
MRIPMLLALLCLSMSALAEDIEVTNRERPVMVGTPVMDDRSVTCRGVDRALGRVGWTGYLGGEVMRVRTT